MIFPFRPRIPIVTFPYGSDVPPPSVAELFRIRVSL